jgi:hypothetical protein
LQVSANRAEGLPSWKSMRRRKVWFSRKGFGCISVPIWEVKTEIPAKQLPSATHHTIGIRTRITNHPLKIPEASALSITSVG